MARWARWRSNRPVRWPVLGLAATHGAAAFDRRSIGGHSRDDDFPYIDMQIRLLYFSADSSMSAPHQLTFRIRTWGGQRRGAGRPPAPGRRRVSHARRPPHDRHCPVHVTLRACKGLPSLRDTEVFGAIRAALARSSGMTFRVLHFSVQMDHVHLLLEADASVDLRRGIQGLVIRVARAINHALGRRGKVFGDRYHARSLRTPREV
ncbi:MAG: hypothetical protein E6J56_22290, partial [Deltaproteobacteria bacterium]